MRPTVPMHPAVALAVLLIVSWQDITHPANGVRAIVYMGLLWLMFSLLKGTWQFRRGIQRIGMWRW